MYIYKLEKRNSIYLGKTLTSKINIKKIKKVLSQSTFQVNHNKQTIRPNATQKYKRSVRLI